NAPWAQIDEV
nr:RecName: Full=Acid phosphatase [Schizophyllum commune]